MDTEVPDSLMKEIQELQDTFGAAMDQAIVLTDLEGRMITRPTIPGIHYKEMLNALEGSFPTHSQVLQRLGGLSDPAVMEWVPGLKYVVTPLAAGYDRVYYLWIGLYMEQETRGQVAALFKERMGEHPAYEQLQAGLIELPELSRERIAEIRGSISALGSIMCKLLANWVLKPHKEHNSKLFTMLLKRLEADFLDIEAVLRLLAEMTEGDVYAFALETDEGNFQVAHAAGREAHLLLNAAFQQGEGFLGQAVLGKEPRHWQAVSKDPRVQFFTRLGFPAPDYLSCYPVKIDNVQRGLLLAAGGSRQEGSGEQQEQMIASLLGISLRGELLLRRAQLGIEGTLRLKEAVGQLQNAGSLQELGTMLLDIVMGLPFPLSSVLVHFQTGEHAAHTYYARGWAPESEDYYVKDLEGRYSRQSFLSSAIIREVGGTQILLECPLLSGNEFKGVLSVGFRRRGEAELWITQLETIAGLAGAAIRLIERDSRCSKQSEMFLANFRDFLQVNNTQLYYLSLDAAELIREFARYLERPEAEAELLRRACLLAPFRSDLLGVYGFLNREIELLEKVDKLRFQHLAADKPALSFPAELLVLVLQHMSSLADRSQLAGQPQKWIDPARFIMEPEAAAAVEEKLLSSFRLFQQSRTHSRPKKRVISGSRLLDNAALTLPKEEWGISPREEEVLELIVQGKTNKEIAGALFISEHTVKNHLSRIFNKMNVTDRSQIIALIYKRILNSERIEI